MSRCAISRRKSEPIVFWIAFLVGFFTLHATSASGEIAWIVEDATCIRTGDVPVCAATYSLEEATASVGILLKANQDSPIIGRLSRGEKRIQFERSFTAAWPVSLTVTAQFSGTVFIEGGAGRVVIEADAVVLDASTRLPVDVLPSCSGPALGHFRTSLSSPGSLEPQGSDTLTLALPAGDYIIQGSMEAITEIAPGWRNFRAEANGLFSLALQIESAESRSEIIDPAADAEGMDRLIIPLGVAGTSYAHLETGIPGGSFTVCALLDPKGWNAVTAHDTATTRFTNILMQGLLDIDPNSGKLVPELARSWSISEDGLEILIPLRRGLQWSDGAPFTADDVLFTFNDLYLNPDVEADIREQLRLPDGTFPSVEKVDESTIRFVLAVPFRPILAALCANIMPKHKLEDFVHKLNPEVPPGTFNVTWTLDTDPAEIVGMGPFVLAGFSRGQTLVMQRNPYYYHFDPNGVRLPYVDTYVVRWFTDALSMLLDFRGRKMDAFTPQSGDVFALKRTAEERGVTVVIDTETSVNETLWISINQDVGLSQGTDENLRALFRDLRFRQAIAHAIDKESIILNAYNGMAVPQWSPVCMASPYYAGRSEFGSPITEQGLGHYDFDLQRTTTLFDEIGIVDRNGDGWRDFIDGSTVQIVLNTATRADAIDFRTPVRNSICTFLVEDLRAVGLDVDFQSLDFNSLVEKLHAASYQMALFGLESSLDPASEANVYQSSGDKHFWHLSAGAGDRYETEQVIDALLFRGAGTYDETEAFAAYRQFQIAFSRDDLGLLFVVNPAFVYAFYNDIGNAQVANPIANPSGSNGLTMDLVFHRSN